MVGYYLKPRVLQHNSILLLRIVGVPVEQLLMRIYQVFNCVKLSAVTTFGMPRKGNITHHLIVSSRKNFFKEGPTLLVVARSIRIVGQAIPRVCIK